MLVDLETRVFIKDGDTLRCGDRHAHAMLAKIANGARVLVGIRRPRNIDHHRKLFALLNLVVENSDRWADATILLEDLKLATGLFVTRVSALTGMPYPVPASISFAAMTQSRFDDWYAKAVKVLSDHLGTDVEALSSEVAQDHARAA